ncbi:mobilome CxxCx(11)CxxC protein, partial [Streptomyces sp. NPDC004290]
TALADDPPTLASLRTQYEKLEVEDSARRDRDSEKGVTDKERRRGMRATLRKFQRQCAGCQLVPTSLTPSDCDVCGRF